MTTLFATARLGHAFNELTIAARGYLPPRQQAEESGLPRLMDAAVRFTIQLAIDVAEWHQAHARDLESTLIAKLATWIDEEGALTLRLWTHDMSCVIEHLARASHRYAHPQTPFSEGVVKHVMETLPKSLTIAAVAFTIQLVLEETQLPPAAMRGLESVMIRKLEAPWEFKLPLSVDVQDGPSWESFSKKE